MRTPTLSGSCGRSNTSGLDRMVPEHRQKPSNCVVVPNPLHVRLTVRGPWRLPGSLTGGWNRQHQKQQQQVACHASSRYRAGGGPASSGKRLFSQTYS
jgi:hypothetical protein